jgi:hypothetical protein
VIGLYELLDNPTTKLIEPPGPLYMLGQANLNTMLHATQTVRHDIAEILLKVALKHKKSNQTKHIQDRNNVLLYLKHILLLERKWIRHTYFNFIEMW